MQDALYMQRCFSLAKNGLGRVAPNPLVGCVIVNNDRIIGEGFHTAFGKAHAEVEAIQSVKDKMCLPDATLYVNLEPCCHTGKTPPCSKLIIESGIKRVVLANADPFALVNGGGVAALRQAGIEVVQGVLAEEGRNLNKRFFTFHEKERPYIILKWAQSSDGFIDHIRTPAEKPLRISDAQSTRLVHKWRTEEQAILIGKNTALLDNPMLTARYWAGKNPLRLVTDRHAKLPTSLSLFKGDAQTIVLTENYAETKETYSYVPIDYTCFFESFFALMHSLSIQSVLVEGGRVLLQSFIDKKCWDEARVIQSLFSVGKGIAAPRIPQAAGEVIQLDKDCLHVYYS